AGIHVEPHWIIESDYTSPGGYQAAVGLLSGTPPTAIFAGNDMIGIGVLRAAAERGIQVPRDLSVVGFDDIEMSRYVYPALTTVGQSIVELGESAAQMLLRRISGAFEGATEQRVVTPSIVLRESTAPPIS
ncbi:MAG: substrate-binding domain-containing protein, partial [Pseudomonas caspiana]